MCRLGLLVRAAIPWLAGASTPLDDYLGEPEATYSWRDTGVRVSGMLFGGTADLLNVTSLSWMDTSRASGLAGSVWSHQVAVVVPKNLLVMNTSVAIFNGNCNDDPVPDKSDEYLVLADNLAAQTGMVVVVIYQIPNCPIVFPSDPRKMRREEDSLLGWGFREFLEGGGVYPQWLPLLPMAKSAMAGMRAVGEYVEKKLGAKIDGWIVSGASKRGWTSWLVSAARCPPALCPRVVGACPIVPIVPSLHKSIHVQERDYGGVTFAWRDYKDAGLFPYLDSPAFDAFSATIDPGHQNYLQRLAALPTVAVLSSDDEFMALDWTVRSWPKIPGESRFLIAPNTEHSMVTSLPDVISALSAFGSSIAAAEAPSQRPAFTWTQRETGELDISIPVGSPTPHRVVMRHTETLQAERVDFRWVRLADNETRPCTPPGIPIKPMEGGGNCLQPMVWQATQLVHQPGKPREFRASPPRAKQEGHYVGYYVELFFASRLPLSPYHFTTAGYVWPDRLPFDECSFGADPKLKNCSRKLL
jgi:hypothetical protein